MVKKCVFAKMAPDHFSPSRNFESFRGSKTEKNVFFGTFGRFSALTANKNQKFKNEKWTKMRKLKMSKNGQKCQK